MPSVIQRIGETERKYVLDVLADGFSSATGAKYMTKLESAFAEKYGSKFAVSFVNGTATLHAALEAAGIGCKDEVIVPPLTMSSTSLAVLHANATPVSADIDPKTFLIEPQSIKEKITPQTKAIITVALYGLSPDMDPIIDIAKKHNLIVIEDNAQAFLSYYKGKLAGTIGKSASFSFQSSKHMTSGEGGIVITDDEEYALRIRKFSGLGYSTLSSKKARITKDEIQHPSFERHDFLGWNYRMPELCCACALGQLEHLDELIEVRKKSAKILREAIGTCTWLVPQYVSDQYIHSYWTLACKLVPDTIAWDDFREKFLSLGGHKFYGAWQLTYLEPLFLQRKFATRDRFISQNYQKGLCPVAEVTQPYLLQFKTNFWNLEDAEKQADVLHKTIRYFDGGKT